VVLTVTFLFRCGGRESDFGSDGNEFSSGWERMWQRMGTDEADGYFGGGGLLGDGKEATDSYFRSGFGILF